jgi:hypothetical protein
MMQYWPRWAAGLSNNEVLMVDFARITIAIVEHLAWWLPNPVTKIMLVFKKSTKLVGNCKKIFSR